MRLEKNPIDVVGYLTMRKREKKTYNHSSGTVDNTCILLYCP